jgi:hypothetical protein
MDHGKMADLIREKHGTALDPGDPVFLLATVADELHKEGRQEFARIAAELSDQVSAALVLADTTARARSERLITEAAKWSSEQIREAGVGIVRQMEAQLAHSQQAARVATIAAWVTTSAAVGCTVLISVMLLLSR